MKKKIFSATLAVCLLVISIVGTTVAYFTDKTFETATFTSGNVNIEFVNTVFTTSGGQVYPGMQVGESAKVVNVGSEEAYIGLAIKFEKTGIADLIKNADDVKAMFVGLAGEEIAYTAASDSVTVYVYKADSVVKNSYVTFFNSITIPAAWGNAEMEKFANTNITVTAYATQKAGFNNAKDALVKSFVEEWAPLAPTP